MEEAVNLFSLKFPANQIVIKNNYLTFKKDLPDSIFMLFQAAPEKIYSTIILQEGIVYFQT
jgi:hypothetical protein